MFLRLNERKRSSHAIIAENMDPHANVIVMSVEVPSGGYERSVDCLGATADTASGATPSRGRQLWKSARHNVRCCPMQLSAATRRVIPAVRRTSESCHSIRLERMICEPSFDVPVQLGNII